MHLRLFVVNQPISLFVKLNVQVVVIEFAVVWYLWLDANSWVFLFFSNLIIYLNSMSVNWFLQSELLFFFAKTSTLVNPAKTLIPLA